MRILFISAFYPPYVIGGWEQLVQDLNLSLRARGHTTYVLTSNYGVNGDDLQEQDVERVLQLESSLSHYKPLDFFISYGARTERNLKVTRQTIDRFNPDVIFIHVMWNLSRGVAWTAEQILPGRVVYYVASDWPYRPDPHSAYWQNQARKSNRQLLKQALAPVALQAIRRRSNAFPLSFERVLCVSHAIQESLEQQAGIPADNMQVVYNGVELDKFVFSPPSRNDPISLLYAGSLVPHKGVHTAIEAMGLLADQGRLGETTLTLVGSGRQDYEARLKKMAAERGVSQQVFFWPRVDRKEMPALLSKFDVLVFPSTWEEPLARMMQEGMAAGLVVVGTPTGGTPEILKDEQTGLVFPPEDAAALARQLDRLAKSPDLRLRLAVNARREVENRFSYQRMVAEVEAVLSEVAFDQSVSIEEIAGKLA